MIPATWLIAQAFLALIVLQPQVSDAQPYGAIAYDRPTSSWGASYNARSQEAANQRAMIECQKFGSHCGVVVRFWGELCAAYATGSGKADGWSTGATHAAAEQGAIGACSTRESRCEARVWSCNTRGGSAQIFQPGPIQMCTWWDARKNQSVTGFCSSSERPR